MTCSQEQKVTTMVLRVDLDCYQCYKKVKKLLCKFPQIRNQEFDEKKNVVIITVVCCSPEKIRDKLRCKGGKSIKSIEILQPKPAPPPDEPQKPKPKPVPAPVTVPVPVPEKPKPAPPPEKPNPAPSFAPDQKPPEKIQKNGSKNGSKKPDPSQEAAPKATPKPTGVPAPAQPKPQGPVVQWVPVYPPGPPPQAFPVSVCCASCYEGRPGGPCYVPGPGYPYGYHGPPYQPGYCVSRCDYYLSEENPSACSIM